MLSVFAHSRYLSVLAFTVCRTIDRGEIETIAIIENIIHLLIFIRTIKLIAVFVTFPAVLSAGIISKGAIFFMTSQIGREMTQLASGGQIQLERNEKEKNPIVSYSY